MEVLNSPWTLSTNDSQKFSDIMSEQLALQLWQDDCPALHGKIELHSLKPNQGDCSQDENLARMLQLQFLEETKSNKNHSTGFEMVEEEDIERSTIDAFTILQWSNKICKPLNSNSRKRKAKAQGKLDKFVAKLPLDLYSQTVLSKLIQKSILAEIVGTINVGRKSTILSARGGRIEEEFGGTIFLPHDCIVKVFKNFAKDSILVDDLIDEGLKEDLRIDRGLKYKLVKSHHWNEEVRNLNRMAEADIPCPKVLYVREHILVLEFLGDDGQPAPKLKNVDFELYDNGTELLKRAYQETINIMVRMYQKCNLVHSDLSEYNILWYKNTCYCIDLASAVDSAHPNAFENLFRDCSNVCNFFQRKGEINTMEPASLFLLITGTQYNGNYQTSY